MRIAQIAPLIERVPPTTYGGTERVVSGLTEELVKRGHTVTLFASGDSKTSAHLISVIPKSLRRAQIDTLYGGNAYSMLSLGLAYSMQKNFDVIHDHGGELSVALANLSKTPVVMTMHNAIHTPDKKLYKTLSHPYIVTISHSQSTYTHGFNHIGTVYNGLDFTHYPFSATHEGYLLYVGRISPEKGVHLAIKTARRLKLPLIMAAKLDPAFAKDVSYFKNRIKPYLSSKIRWIGEVDEKKRNQLMSKAMAFLHPVQWPEPFGLTMIEAMACGTPVIAFNNGSIPEVVLDKKTGFVINSWGEMMHAVKNVHEISRELCRDYARTTFSTSRMVDGYEQIYKKIAKIPKKKIKVAAVKNHTKSTFFPSQYYPNIFPRFD